MKNFFRSCCITLLLIALSFACGTDAEDTQILEAAREYVKNNADLEVSVEVEEVADDYARVHVTPEDPEAADEAIMYLKKTNGKWEGIAIGTSFSPDDFQALRIPEKIR